MEAQLQNRHLDPNYFLKGGQVDPVHATAKMAPEALAGHAGNHKKTLRIPAAPQAAVPASGPDTHRIRKAAGPLPLPDAMHRGPAQDQTGKVRKALNTRFYVIGLLFSLLLLGATVFIPAKKEPGPPTSQFVQLVNQNEIRSPEPIPERRVAPPQPPDGRPAVVMVPSTGLRSSHSMESHVIPRITVRQKERVDILRRFSSQTGPDWIQVRTKSGTVGWVVASVVKEIRG